MGSPYLGEIRIISFNFPPKGWTFCNGQLLSIQQNQALFAVLGTTYGGNGTTNFALPNFQGRVPVHTGSGIVLGQVGGETAHTLITAEMPTHTHNFVAANPANAPAPGGNAPGKNPSAPFYAASGSIGMNPASITNNGSSQPHSNEQPYLVMNFIIALTGIFPSRN